MPESGTYEVRSIDHPEKSVVIHLEVVDRETILGYERYIEELELEVTRLKKRVRQLRYEVAS